MKSKGDKLEITAHEVTEDAFDHARGLADDPLKPFKELIDRKRIHNLFVRINNSYTAIMYYIVL
jgi:hypothetical protein